MVPASRSGRACGDRAVRRLARRRDDRRTKFWRGAATAKTAKGPRAYLLPPFDEYTVAYADRSHVGVAPARAQTFNERTLLGPNLVLDGQIVGSWKRTLAKTAVAIALSPWTKLDRKDIAALDEAATRYADFLGLSPRISYGKR